MITVAALTPSLDLTYLVDAVDVGRIRRTPDLLRVAGGKSLNLARAARTMGAECAVVALLGGATGRMVEQLLREEEVEVSTIDGGAETRICTTLACASTGELTEVYADAPAVPADALTEFVGAVERNLLVHDGWLALAGRAPEGAHEVVGNLVRLGQLCGHRVAVDTHSEALAYAVGQQPDLVKINRAEAAHLVDRPPDDDLVMLAQAVADRSGGWVVVTDGVHGAVSVAEGQTLRLSGLPIRGHFPVGSGDSFLGGMLAALEAGADQEGALRAGLGSATANAMVPGQGRFDSRLAERLSGQARVITEASSPPE